MKIEDKEEKLLLNMIYRSEFYNEKEKDEIREYKKIGDKIICIERERELEYFKDIFDRPCRLKRTDATFIYLIWKSGFKTRLYTLKGDKEYDLLLEFGNKYLDIMRKK